MDIGIVEFLPIATLSSPFEFEKSAAFPTAVLSSPPGLVINVPEVDTLTLPSAEIGFILPPPLVQPRARRPMITSSAHIVKMPAIWRVDRLVGSAQSFVTMQVGIIQGLEP